MLERIYRHIKTEYMVRQSTQARRMYSQAEYSYNVRKDIQTH
jgi:hypothetical protein